MDPKHLTYLACIFDKGSITAAAKHLGIAQPTLTRAMATLEMQSGSQLFLRSRYGVKPTAVGEALAREGRAITHSMNLAREQVSRYKLGFNSELRIATGPLLCLGVLPKIVASMTQQYPDMALTVSSVTPSLGIEAIKNDQFDVFLAPSPDERMVKGLQRSLVASDEYAIFCGTAHALTNKKSLAAADFERTQWLSIGTSNTFEHSILDMLMRAGITQIRTKVSFRNDGATLMHLLSQGDYLSVLPRLPIQAIATQGQVQSLDFITSPIQRNLYLWAREDILQTPAYLAFAEVTAKVFDVLINTK